MQPLAKRPFSHDPPRASIGELDLGIAVSGGRSIAKRQFHRQALKIIRPHYLDDSGQVYYTIINPGGGFVGGDEYRISIEVEAGASALVTDQSATKVYRTPEDFAVQNIDLRVGDGAVLEYIPDQLILYRDADFRQQITADVHENGSLLMSEIITPGWSPDGGKFLYDLARLRNVVSVGGELDLIDNLVLTPKDPVFTSDRSLYLGGETHVATLICYDPGIDETMFEQVRELVAAHRDSAGELDASVTRTDRPGFVLRALGQRTEILQSLVLAVADHLRAKLRRQGPINLRKY